MLEILIYAAFIVTIAMGGMSIYADLRRVRLYKKAEQVLNKQEL